MFNAAALNLLHNHMSGVVEPGQADQHVTKHPQDAVTLAVIRAPDHSVANHGESVGFAESRPIW